MVANKMNYPETWYLKTIIQKSEVLSEQTVSFYPCPGYGERWRVATERGVYWNDVLVSRVVWSSATERGVEHKGYTNGIHKRRTKNRERVHH